MRKDRFIHHMEKRYEKIDRKKQEPYRARWNHKGAHRPPGNYIEMHITTQPTFKGTTRGNDTGANHLGAYDTRETH